ncbi:hypothetical protein BGW42_001625 [Actinomortierella wolfii]|nr:hypothetical protein BGW42_001625 [Actinomortierella wolfii]
MLLQGQTAELYTCKFSPSGEHIASAGAEKNIYLWNTYGESNNYGIIKGHNATIVELQWSRNGDMIFTASADKTCGVFDVETGERIKKFKGHTSFVNSCSPARRGVELLASGADDGSVKIWDLRAKDAVESFDSRYQITAVSFSEAGDLVFAGGIDNKVAAWDMRKKAISYSLVGHMDTISGMQLSPDGNQLLTNAMDNTVRVWDVKPFAANGTRLLKTFEGAPHGFEKNLIRPAWSKDGTIIGVGSGDRSVVVWDAITRKILYKLPGHKGCVNEVDFHPKEPIAVMAGKTGAMPVPLASHGSTGANLLPRTVVITPPRHLPHSLLRRFGDTSFPIAENDANNFITDKRAPHPADAPMGTLSLSVPLFATLLFALIVLATVGIAHCLYRRYARNLEGAFGVHNNQLVGSHAWRFSSYNDASNDDGYRDPTETDRLLGGRQPQERRRSTSYYDANRSRSAAPVVIQTDMKGRPISTWSTASSVAAQRGEELSRWSKRRDELIAQYGQGKDPASNANNNQYHHSLTEDPEDVVEEVEEEEDIEDNRHSQQRSETRVEYSAALNQAQLQDALQHLKHYEHDTTFGREPADAPGSIPVSSMDGEHGTGTLP